MAGLGTSEATSVSRHGDITGRTSRSALNWSRRVLGDSHRGIFGQPAHVFGIGHIGWQQHPTPTYVILVISQLSFCTLTHSPYIQKIWYLSCLATSCPVFSCPAISCLSFSRPAIWSVIFMSCISMPCYLVRQFHVLSRTHWLEHSMNDIVNKRLPVKMLFCSEYCVFHCFIINFLYSHSFSVYDLP